MIQILIQLLEPFSGMHNLYLSTVGKTENLRPEALPAPDPRGLGEVILKGIVVGKLGENVRVVLWGPL